MNALYITLVLVLSISSATAQPVKSDPIVSGLDSVITEYGKKGLFSGYLHVQQGNEVLYSSGNGWQDQPGGLPFTDSTLFCIGSITKVFTAAAIYVLQQKGLLNVTDRVGTYLPALAAYPEITIQHLLYHSSCLPYGFWGLRDRLGLDTARLEARHIYQHIDSTRRDLHCQPNSRAVYSNIGYMMLGDLIERVSGMTYRQFLERHLFSPLGMKRTTVADRLYLNREGFANTFVRKRRKGAYRAPDYLDVYRDFYLPTSLPGAGLIYSTPRDLMKLRDLWQTDAVLADSTRAKLATPWRLADGSVSEEAYPGYAKVMMVQPFGVSYQMTGGLPGQQCLVFHSPKTDITVVYVNNEIIYKNKYFSWDKCREPMRQSILQLASSLPPSGRHESAHSSR